MERSKVQIAISMGCLLVVLPGVALGAQPPGAESPQALVERLQDSAERGDFVDLMACIAPDDRRELAMGMVLGAGMMIAFMGLGAEMAGGFAEAMVEGVTEEEVALEDRVEIERAQAEAASEMAALQARYEAILDRHGVTAMMEDETPLPEEPEARSVAIAELFRATDDIVLTTELLALITEIGEAQGQEGGPGAPIEVPPEVTGYEISGDRATAQAGDETLHFVRVDGRWYLAPNM